MKIIVNGQEVDNVKLKFEDMKEMLDFGCMMHACPSVGLELTDWSIPTSWPVDPNGKPFTSP